MIIEIISLHKYLMVLIHRSNCFEDFNARNLDSVDLCRNSISSFLYFPLHGANRIIRMVTYYGFHVHFMLFIKYTIYILVVVGILIYREF